MTTSILEVRSTSHSREATSDTTREKTTRWTCDVDHPWKTIGKTVKAIVVEDVVA